MPTYVSSSSNPSLAFEFTGISLTQKYVSGTGHKVYTYWHVDTSVTSPIPMSGLVKQVAFTLSTTTNNVYWKGATANGQDVGTVGSDIVMSPIDGNPTFNQYIDMNYNGPLGQPTDSALANCVPATQGYPASVNSGGEERHAVYLVFTDPAETKAYVITEGILLYYDNGVVAIDFLIEPSQTTGFSFTSDCVASTLSFNSFEVDWAIMTPPPTNTIPGSYQIYPTVGGLLSQASGTNALVLEQYGGQLLTTSSSSSTHTTTTTSLSTSSISDSGSSSTSTSTSSSITTSTTIITSTSSSGSTTSSSASSAISFSTITTTVTATTTTTG
jgi:hypothetical protein